MIPEQSPAGVLRQRITDLEVLRERVDDELAEARNRLRRIDGRSTARNVTPAGVNPTHVRAWGAANGWTLADRGRLPSDLIQQYLNRPRQETQ